MQELKNLTNAGLSAQLINLIEAAPVISEEAIAAGEYLKQFQGLKIVDVETYRAAKAYASEIRAKRLDLDKQFTGATSALKTLVKGYEKEAASLISLYKTTESEIRDEIKRVDDEKKAAAEAEERAKAAAFMERTNQLFEVGYTFDGWQYKVGLIVLTPESIAGMSDELLQQYIQKGQEESQRIAAILSASQPKTETPKIEQVQDAGEWFAMPQSASDAPYLPPSVPSDFFDPAPTAAAQENFRPSGFTAGFDACKARIIELLLDDSRKFTRAELINVIKSLKA